MRETVLLFDLDGTLTDSKEGIVKSVIAALDRFHVDSEGVALEGFIGPPLTWSFPHFFGFDEQQTAEAISVFRERYARIGKFENRVYDGIPEMLEKLRFAGYRLAVATSKPEHFALEILEHFSLTPYFDLIAGTGPDEKGEKEEVVRDALARLGGISPTQALMIGDRKHDVIGAHKVGLRAVGVLWGYGDKEELVTHGADFFADSPNRLLTLLGDVGK